MKYLFVHQNYPGQFRYLAPALVRQGSDVRALVMRKNAPRELDGVKLLPYWPDRSSTSGIHPWAVDFETKVIRGESAFRAAVALRAAGYSPDVIIAHHGWGESMFLKDVWPAARLGLYCEFYYHATGADVGFDPEFPGADVDEACRQRLKNVNNLLHFEIADAGISPTQWQASTFPESFRRKITVVHDGIDTSVVAPNPDASLTIKTDCGPLSLSRRNEIITFVNRDLEPYRGYHVFMRALPEILSRRPAAQVLIVGGDGVSYGAKPPKGQTWKSIFAQEARGRMSDDAWSRVSFLGKIPYQHFVSLLQISTVHVYLTYPFVLSWSLLEAMSAGCAIVASDTAPLCEAIRHDKTGRLVPFFNGAHLAEEVCSLANDRDARERLGANARAFAKAHYDLHEVCLPRQLRWVEELTRSR